MMATQLDYRNIPAGRMYFRGEGLGGFHNVDPDLMMTSAEMIQQTGLDWTVVQRPICYLTEKGTYKDVPGKVANVRSDNGHAMGVVGKGYTPMQNVDGFSFADELVQTGNGGWIGAREEKGGARVHALMRLSRDVRIGGLEDETILPLLGFRNGHDGGMGVVLHVAPFRAACMNGMMIPIKGAQRTWRYRHTSGIKARMHAAREALEISWTYYDELEELGNKLVAQKMGPKQFGTFLANLIPLDPLSEPDSRAAKNRDEALEAISVIWRSAENLTNVRGTKWAALQAVGEWNDWGKSVRGKTDEAKMQQRMTRQLKPSPIKDRALALLTA
jgi:phage/plasmid-like protein (TIGR03299 family)